MEQLRPVRVPGAPGTGSGNTGGSGHAGHHSGYLPPATGHCDQAEKPGMPPTRHQRGNAIKPPKDPFASKSGKFLSLALFLSFSMLQRPDSPKVIVVSIFILTINSVWYPILINRIETDMNNKHNITSVTETKLLILVLLIFFQYQE